MGERVPQEQISPFGLRMQPSLKAAIDAAARENNRSLNAEIVARLEGGERSLRDWFAGQALVGILAGGFADTVPHDDVSGGREAAFFAYQYADAMLAERDK